MTNIVYFDSGTVLSGDLSNDNYVFDWNLYFDTRADAKPDQLRLGPCSWAKWQQRGHDLHSVVANPLFVAPAGNDFHIPANSPAIKLGFRPFDLSGAGPRSAASPAP